MQLLDSRLGEVKQHKQSLHQIIVEMFFVSPSLLNLEYNICISEKQYFNTPLKILTKGDTTLTHHSCPTNEFLKKIMRAERRTTTM
jgi:hypothetical protein